MLQNIFRKALLFFIITSFMPIHTAFAEPLEVTYANYVEVEVNKAMQRALKFSNGLNKWGHIRKPTPLDEQTIIRMNRDTLYSQAIIDVSKGVKITVPDAAERYISIHILNEYGYTVAVKVGAGTYKFDAQSVGSDFATVIARIFVDADNTEDVKIVNNLQDKLTVEAQSAMPFQAINWDIESYNKISQSLQDLGPFTGGSKDMFGSKDKVDPIRFMIGAATGYGGMPEENAMYFSFAPSIQDKNYTMSFDKMPQDAFWSVTVYNKKGFLFNSEHGVSNLNSATAQKSEDGSYTLYFGNCEKNEKNCLAIEEGWNSVLRLYEPHEEVVEGLWTPPTLKAVE